MHTTNENFFKTFALAEVIDNTKHCTVYTRVFIAVVSFYRCYGDITREYALTHWGRVTHICVSKLTIIGSDNGLSPDRRQAIIWTNAGKLLFGPPGTNLSGIVLEIHTFSFKKMHLKMSSGKWRPFCLGLNVLIQWPTLSLVTKAYIEF